jgi:hypothetical protein
MKLHIFGKIYRILKIRGLKNSAEIDYDNKIISVSEDEIGEQFIHSIIHEMGHAVFDRISIDKTSIPDDVKEIICDTIATTIIENFNISLREHNGLHSEEIT